MKDSLLKLKLISQKIHDLDNELLFLPERIKIEQVEKLVTNLHDKTEYVIHIKNLKQALNHGLLLKKFLRVIKFKSKSLTNAIYWNETLKKAKNNFEKDFFKLIENPFFRKTMENMKKVG